MATDWSEEAKARRSASAKKAARTRKANQAREAQKRREGLHMGENYSTHHGYIRQYKSNSRVARWALSGVSMIAMLRMNRRMRGSRTYNRANPLPWDGADELRTYNFTLRG